MRRDARKKRLWPHMSARAPTSIAIGTITIWAAVMQAAREIMVDGVFRDRQDADNARHRHQSQQVEHDLRAEQIGRAARDGRGHGIAGVIERFVASYPCSEGAVTDDAERHRCDRGREDDARCVRNASRDSDWPE